MSKLKVDPSPDISFDVIGGKPSSCPLRLFNSGTDHMAFKVKTTAPKKYCVRPNAGVIPPGKHVEVHVIPQVGRGGEGILASDLQGKCKDKFMIQSTTVPVDEPLTPELWGQVPPAELGQTLLRCKYKVRARAARAAGCARGGSRVAPRGRRAGPAPRAEHARFGCFPTGARPRCVLLASRACAAQLASTAGGESGSIPEGETTLTGVPTVSTIDVNAMDFSNADAVRDACTRGAHPLPIASAQRPAPAAPLGAAQHPPRGEAAGPTQPPRRALTTRCALAAARSPPRLRPAHARSRPARLCAR